MTKPPIVPLVPPPAPASPALDRFGIPVCRSLLGETEAERLERIRLVERLIEDAFQAAVTHLGEAAAKAAWVKASRAKRGPKKPTRDARWDEILLALYDHAVNNEGIGPSVAPRLVAELLLPKGWKEPKLRANDKLKSFGVKSLHPPGSAETIEKHLRRLLAKRSLPLPVHADAPPSLLGMAGHNFGRN